MTTSLKSRPASDKIKSVSEFYQSHFFKGLSVYCKATAIYLASRFVVFLGVSYGKSYITLGNQTWLGGNNWYHRLLRWDSEWYKIIATEGYRYNGNPGETQTVVFYPFYPMLSRLFSEILHIEIFDAMLLVANLAAIAAILLIFKITRQMFDERVAFTTVALLSFFPASVFLSAGYTEPLALLLIVLFFLAVASQRFLSAAVIAGLAVGTRSSGITLLPVLMWELWNSGSAIRFVKYAIPLALIATSGLWLYMIYLGVTVGHPLAFADGQAAFHENTQMSSRFIAALLLEPFRNISWLDFSPAGLDHWFALLFIVLIITARYAGLPVGMTIFTAGILALPYFTLSGGPAGFTSMARFNIVSFPLFIVAAVLSERLRWARLSGVGVFGGLLLIYAALFSQWQWVG